MRRALAIALTVAACLCGPVTAQEKEEGESGGMLVDFLQDTLSGDNRQIKVVGLEGALSARATIKELTVADDEGVWLTISGAVLDWNRLALVRGRFSVNTLSADEIIVARTPNPSPAPAELPSAEAQPFQVPELPVAIELGEIRVDRFELGEPLIGLAAELSLAGALTLADGALDSNLAITRLDRPGDEIDLIAKFANETSQIDLDLKVIEDAGGLISTVLKMPDSPPLLLTAKGSGPVTDFTADIALATGDAERVTGQVRLQEVPTPGAPATDNEQAPGSIAFTAVLNGDVTPMLPEDYRAFFGADTALDVAGRHDPDGRLEIGKLDLRSDALSLNGTLALAASGELEAVKANGGITPPQGDTVVLPMTGPQTTLGRAHFKLDFDATQGNAWDLTLSADRFEQPDLSLDHAEVTGEGTLEQSNGFNLDGDLQAALAGLVFSDPALNEAVGPDIRLAGHFATPEAGVLDLGGFTLRGAGYSADLDGRISGLDSGFQMDGDFGLVASDLSRFAAISGQDLAGSVTAQVTGQMAPLNGTFDMVLDVTGQDLQAGIKEVDALVSGKTTVHLDAARGTTGLDIRAFTLNGAAIDADVKGKLSSRDSDLTFRAALDDVARVSPLVSGPVTLSGDAKQTGTLWDGKLDLKGPDNSFAKLAGTLDPNGYVMDGDVELVASDISWFAELVGQDIAGAINAKLSGQMAPQDLTFDVVLDVIGQDLQAGIEQVDPLIAGKTTLSLDAARDASSDIDIRTLILNGTALDADVKGNLSKTNSDLTFRAGLDDLSRVTTLISGPLTVSGDAKQVGTLWDGNIHVKGPETSYAKLAGTLDPKGNADLTFEAVMDRLERFVPEVAGSLRADGSAKRDNGKWTIDTNAEGPSQISAAVAGTFDETSGNADLTAKGQVHLGAANLFISPNSVQGSAAFDLAVKGQPSLESVSGTITTSGTTFAIPAVAQTIDPINATVQLNGTRANISVDGGIPAGGGFRVSGPVTLQPPFDGRLTIQILQLVLTDNISFTSSANGQLVFSGPLAGDANLSGRIEFGETEINLNAVSGAVGAAPIPEIRHTSEPSPVYATREHAGLTDVAKSGSGPAIGLDIELLARKRVFATGFGLNAELGGDLKIGGTSLRVEPSGQIELVRGHLDLLGRRLKLTKGLVTMQGDLTPYVEFESATNTSDGVATIEIAGPMDSPSVTVFSEPERPSEEALAMLLFGNRASDISPFQIAQMAASLATLRSGGKTQKKIKDETGVDTVDIGSDGNGGGRLGAGAYLSDNLYTDVTVNTTGETELNLNLDVSESLTLRGSVDNAGQTGIGVFFSRDY